MIPVSDFFRYLHVIFCFQSHWVANKEPMLAFLEEADKMIRGIVTDGVRFIFFFCAGWNICKYTFEQVNIFAQVGQAVGGARVRVEERGKDLVTSSRGEFWRLLTPGLFGRFCLFLVGVSLCVWEARLFQYR